MELAACFGSTPQASRSWAWMGSIDVSFHSALDPGMKPWYLRDRQIGQRDQEQGSLFSSSKDSAITAGFEAQMKMEDSRSDLTCHLEHYKSESKHSISLSHFLGMRRTTSIGYTFICSEAVRYRTLDMSKGEFLALVRGSSLGLSNTLVTLVSCKTTPHTQNCTYWFHTHRLKIFAHKAP